MDEQERRIVIVQTDDGRVGVRIQNLPADKVTLFGLLRVAEEMVPQIVKQAGGRVQLPPGVLREV